MSFAHLLQRAPFYSPAKGSPPRQKRPNEPAPLASLLQAHRIPGRPLVNPYEALSASDFDSFVTSVSGKITSALTYDAKAQANKTRGYLDDEEYWMEMGGKPGEFLGGQMQASSNGEEQAQDAGDTDRLLDQLYDVSQGGPDTVDPKDRLYPDLNGLQEEQAASSPPSEDPEDAQLTFHRASSVFDEYLRNLQDGQLETEEQPEEAETEIEEYQEDEEDLGVLPELNGEASDAMPIDSLLDAAADDVVEQAMLESEEIIEDIHHDLQAIQQAEEEEEQLDLELEQELGLQPDINISATQESQRQKSESRPIPDRRSVSQVIELDDTTSEEEVEVPVSYEQGVVVKEEQEKEEQEEEQEEDEDEDVEEEEKLPAFVPARPQVGRKTVPQAVTASIASTSILKEPIPSQARLLKERTRMRLDEEAKEASGYESDEESEGYQEDEDIEQKSVDEEEEEQMQDEDAADEEEEMREYRRMRRKMKKQRNAIREQDIEDAYFDEQSEGEDDDYQNREEGYDEGENEGQPSRHRNEEGYDTTSSHGTAASDRNKKKWDEEMEDELEDDDVAQQDRAQSGTLDERVPIPAFFKKQKGSNEYEIISGSSEEEDEESEEGAESASEEVSEEQEEVQEVQKEQEDAMRTEITENADSQLVADEDVGDVIQMAIDQAFGQISAQAEAIAAQQPTSSTIEIDSSIEFIGESLPAVSSSLDLGQTPQTDNVVLATAHLDPQVLDQSGDADAVGAALQTSAGVLNDEVTALLNEVLSGADLPMTALGPNQDLQDSTYLMPPLSTVPLPVEYDLPGLADSTLPDSPLPTNPTEVPALQRGTVNEPIDLSENTSLEHLSTLSEISHDSQGELDVAPLQDVAMSGDEMEAAPELTSEALVGNYGSQDLPSPIAQTEQAVAVNEVPGAISGLTEDEVLGDDVEPIPSPPLGESSTPPANLEQDTIAPMVGQTMSGEEQADERASSPPPMQDVGATVDEIETTAETANALQEEAASPLDKALEKSELEPSSKQAMPSAELDYVPLDNDNEGKIVASDAEGQPDLAAADTEGRPSGLSGASAPAEQEEVSPYGLQSHFQSDEASMKNGDAVAQDLAEETMIHPDPMAHQAASLDSDSPVPIEQGTAMHDVPEDMDAAVEKETIADEGLSSKDLDEHLSPSMPEVPDNNTERPLATSSEDAFLGDANTGTISIEVAKSSSPIAEATPTRAFNAIKPGLWDPSTPIRFGGRSLEAAVREAAHDPDRIHSLRESMGMDQDEAVKSAESFRSRQHVEQEAMEHEEPAEEVDSETRAPDYVPLDPVKYIESDDEDMQEPLELPTNSPVIEVHERTGDAVADALAEETSIHPDPIVSLGDGDASPQSPRYISSDDEHDDSLIAKLLSPKRKSFSNDEPASLQSMASLAAFPPVEAESNDMKRSSSSESGADAGAGGVNPSSPSQAVFKHPAVTPKRGRRRKRTSIVTIPVKDDGEDSQASDTNATEELQVQSILTKPSRPRPHRHGRRGSSVTRRSADRTLGTAPAPVHPDAEQQRGDSQDLSAGPHSSPIQTRSHCTYHKLSIPSQARLTTPGRRLSSRLAQAAESRSSTHTPSDYIFLVPGCATSDRKDEMQEEGILDLGVASLEEEGHAVKLSNEDDDEVSVEGIPSSIMQSLVRVIGIDIFRKGECEILAPLVRVEGSSPKQGTPSEKKRKRESDIGTTPSKRSNVTR